MRMGKEIFLGVNFLCMLATLTLHRLPSLSLSIPKYRVLATLQEMTDQTLEKYAATKHL